MSTSKTGEQASSSAIVKRNDYPDTKERPVKSVSVPPTVGVPSPLTKSLKSLKFLFD